MRLKFDKLGVIQTVHVLDDFVEKQSIHLWRLDELREVLKNGGFIRTEFFRAYFLPILQSAVKELSIHQENIHREQLKSKYTTSAYF